jgi:hypothetical protein
MVLQIFDIRVIIRGYKRNMDIHKRQEMEATILMIEETLLPDYEQRLKYLTDEDYDSSSNDDDEFREQDIEFNEAEILECTQLLNKLKQILQSSATS